MPPLPHLEKLKREAKARLADMRARPPVARLADAQQLLARDYGFENWAALKAEVERRNADPATAALREGKARGALFRTGRRTPVEDGDVQSPAPFFRAALAVTVGFVLVAIIGISLVFITTKEGPARFRALILPIAGTAP